MNSYSEPLVVRVTGVPKARIVELRRQHLVKDEDWTLENSVVSYLPLGLKKLLAFAGVDAADVTWPGGESAPAAFVNGNGAAPYPGIVPDREKILAPPLEAAPTPPLVELLVVDLSRNPTIVHARRPEDRALVLVRVRSNANFTPGMKLRARAPTPGATLYHFEGNCPRWKGRY